MRGRYQLHASLSDRTGRGGFQLGAHLVDDDHLRHVVLNRLDHHRMLLARCSDLHPPSLADRWMRDVSVAGDLVRRVHDDNALVAVSEYPRKLAQDRRLADPRPAKQKDAASRHREVFDHAGAPLHSAAHPAGKAYDCASTIADGRDAVERALYSRAVVVPKRTDPLDDVLEVFRGDLPVPQVKVT